MATVESYDAVVVGGGFAGVAAARELASQGLRTVLLEARDRLGGKTWTSQFAGRPVEMGGMSIHWFQPHVWAEVTRYGLGIVQAEPLDTCVSASDLHVERYANAEAGKRDKILYEKLIQGYQEAFDRPYEPLLREDAVTTLDRLSLRDRLDQLELSQDDENWLSGHLSDMAGGSLEKASLSSVVRWFALTGWNYEMWAEAQFRYRFADGTASLIDAMANDQDVEIRLSCPVSEVIQDDEGDPDVRVVTRDGDVVSAKMVVIAVPVNLWSSIRFSPSLSEVRLAASKDSLAAPNAIKLWLKVRGNNERVSAHWPAGSPITRLRSEVRLPDGQIVVGFSPDPNFDPSNRDLVEKFLQDALPGAELVDLLAHDWGRDEYSRGGQPFLRPKQLSTSLSELQQPSGRLVFATSDIANGWSGYMDGAIESGITAARSAKRLIDS